MNQRKAGVLVLVASLLALCMSAYSSWQSYEYARCQGHYNEINNARTKALSDAADQEREAEQRADNAQRSLFTDPALSKSTSERTATEQARLAGLFKEYQDALNAQQQERADADKARRDHPVPPSPRRTCG